MYKYTNNNKENVYQFNDDVVVFEKCDKLHNFIVYQQSNKLGLLCNVSDDVRFNLTFDDNFKYFDLLQH